LFVAGAVFVDTSARLRLYMIHFFSLEPIRKRPNWLREIGASQLEASKVILQLLFPANEYPSESIEPTMSAFDYPASGLLSETSFGFFGFISPRFDVNDVAIYSFEYLLPNGLEIKAFV